MTVPDVLQSKSTSRWHSAPSYHLKPLKGWLNDPCAPGYDPATGTHHLFYQWNPKSCEWGDICWGHFTSKDGLNWEHNGKDPVLEPSLLYDRLGVFTGCLVPAGPGGEKNQLTLIYSSITHLPIHWTLPYTRNCAGLSIASSSDGGLTWQKSHANPVMSGEPEELNVTGFRDPYVSEWAEMDCLRGETNSSLYGIVSGGVVHQGPNAFLYVVSPNDLASWKYVGLLVEDPLRYMSPGRWTGDFGINWECVNFMTIGEGSDKYDLLTLGSEGGLSPKAMESSGTATGVWTLWVAGRLQRKDGGVALQPEFSGILDHGNLYAPNTYQHPSGMRIVWGWIKEEELNLTRRESKGWAGNLSLPRQLFLQRVTNVVRGLKTSLKDIPSLKISNEPPGAAVAQTLGIKPLSMLKLLRTSTPLVRSNIQLPEGSRTRSLGTAHSAHWELEAVIRVDQYLGRIGFHVRHNHNLAQRTSIYFSTSDEEIVVDRSHSNHEPDIQKDTLRGPFTLFVQHEHGREVTERLHLRVFCDGDVLEVFANDRFALSTVVFADDRGCLGISAFSETSRVEDVGEFESIKLWDNLRGKQLQVDEGDSSEP